jgi:hypothetical protein
MATRSPYLLSPSYFRTHPNLTRSPLSLALSSVQVATNGAVSRSKRISITARAASLERIEEVQAVNIADDVTQVGMFLHIFSILSGEFVFYRRKFAI